MKQHQVDIAIIGSGIGGLCAGALAARAGYKVLVAEHLPRIGGRFSSQEYKGYTIHTGGIGAEMGTEFQRTLNEAGVEYQVRRVTPMLYRINGKDYELPEKGGIYKFMVLLGGEAEANKMMAGLRRGLKWQEPSSRISLRDWIRQYTDNEGIARLVQKIAEAGIGAPIDELSAADFVYFIKVAGGWRNYGLMPDGPIAITGGLARSLDQSGGELWTVSPATRILVEDGCAKGIVVEKDGQAVEVAAKAVISNVGARKTVELAGRENLDKGYLSEVEENVIPTRYFWVYTVSDRPLMGPGTLTPIDTQRVFYAVCSTHFCPEHAPAGRHMLQSGSIPQTLTGPVDYKKELDLHIHDLKELFPDFEEHGEVLMATTYRDEWPALRNMPGNYLPQKTPIELLYNVGDTFGSRGNVGGPGAVESAKLAIKDLMQRIKPG